MKNVATNIEIIAIPSENIEADNLVAKLVLVGTDELDIVLLTFLDPPETPTVILPRNPAE